MKVRADIAALLREGHTNASIAHRLHCDPATVSRARKALRLPPAAPAGVLPLSPAQQQANRDRLLAALKEAA